jgi:regulator of sigma E protease
MGAILGGPLANYAAAMIIMIGVFAVVGVAGSPETSAVSAGIRWPIDVSIENLRQIGLMITGAQDGSLAGPVGIVDQLRQSADRGVLDFVVFVALISTVIGMTNLLPMPALDGGRLVFLLYEAVVRRPISRLLEERVHAVGMVCLLCLILVVTVREVYERASLLLA